jgi:hypothetical protein
MQERFGVKAGQAKRSAISKVKTLQAGRLVDCFKRELHCMELLMYS